MVALSGSPPNAAMLFLIHAKATSKSCSPKLPNDVGPSRSSSESARKLNTPRRFFDRHNDNPFRRKVRPAIHRLFAVSEL